MACAVALETLKIYEDDNIIGHVQNVTPAFQNGLAAFKDHPLVGEVRGVGLVGALELVKDKSTKQSFAPALGVGGKVIKHMLEHTMIGRNMGDAIAFSPPLIINETQINDMWSRTRAALDETYAELKASGDIDA